MGASTTNPSQYPSTVVPRTMSHPYGVSQPPNGTSPHPLTLRPPPHMHQPPHLHPHSRLHQPNMYYPSPSPSYPPHLHPHGPSHGHNHLPLPYHPHGATTPLPPSHPAAGGMSLAPHHSQNMHYPNYPPHTHAIQHHSHYANPSVASPISATSGNTPQAPTPLTQKPPPAADSSQSQAPVEHTQPPQQQANVNNQIALQNPQKISLPILATSLRDLDSISSSEWKKDRGDWFVINNPKSSLASKASIVVDLVHNLSHERFAFWFLV